MKLLINIQHGTMEVSCPIFSVSFTLKEIPIVYKEYKGILRNHLPGMVIDKIESIIPVISAYAWIIESIDATTSISLDESCAIKIESEGKMVTTIVDIIHLKNTVSNLLNNEE